MMKPDYKKMNRSELKKHLLSNRNDEQAWTAFFEKLNKLDSNRGYSADLSTEKMKEIFSEKLKQTVKNKS